MANVDNDAALDSFQVLIEKKKKRKQKKILFYTL